VLGPELVMQSQAVQLVLGELNNKPCWSSTIIYKVMLNRPYYHFTLRTATSRITEPKKNFSPRCLLTANQNIWDSLFTLKITIPN
jgi:hypothetical protein